MLLTYLTEAVDGDDVMAVCKKVEALAIKQESS